MNKQTESEGAPSIQTLKIVAKEKKLLEKYKKHMALAIHI